MDYNCDIPFYVGPVFFLLGCGALTMGALAWKFPLPPRFRSIFTRVLDTNAALDQASAGHWVWKVLGPINGTVFVLVGVYMIWRTLHCQHINLGIPDVHGPLAFTWWPGIYPAIAIATFIGFSNARSVKSRPAQVIGVLGTALFGLASGEAAGFHVGIHAAQWGVIAIVSLAFVLLAALIEARTSGPDAKISGGSRSV